jgi:hypothetical protein
MNFLKKMLVILVAVVMILLIVALFVKKEYSLEESIIIEKPTPAVFNYVKLLKNQDNYSVWATMDPNMKKGFEGLDGTVGCVSSWDGNSKVGKGSQTIKKIIEGERIEYELHFIKPFEGFSDSYISTQALSPDQTKVAWGFSSKMKYPTNIVLLFMNMEEMIGKDLSTGLKNLKQILER